MTQALQTRPALRVVGRPVRRLDAVEKVTGQAKYTGDFSLPGMLHAALVPSPFPRGRIRTVDATEALRVPGVRAVVTAADLTDPGGSVRCRDIRYGVVVRDRPILADGEVRYLGEPVAAVAADDPRIAREAAGRVRVEIDPDPPALDLESAIRPDAPRVHRRPYELEDGFYPAGMPLSYESNVTLTTEIGEGDVDEAFRRAARVFEDVYTFPSVYHYAMEPYAVVAACRGDDLTVWSSAQHPYQVQKDLARLFGHPLSRVRVLVPYLGGGFGSKSFTHVEPIAVALAKVTGRPVKLQLDVGESALTSRRHATRARIRSGVDESGRIIAFETEIFFDTGAYTLLGPFVSQRGVYRGMGGYRFPNYRMRSHLVYLNLSPAGSFRAVGGPQSAWGLEDHLNRVAAALGRDPLELRRTHLAVKGEVFRPGRTPLDSDLRENLDTLERLLEETLPALPEPRPPWRVGTGVAMGVCDPGASPVSTALVRLAADGSVVVSVGSTELGQGVRTVMAQLVSETLAVPLERVSVVSTDTVRGPYDATTGASRSTTMSGLAAHRAALDVRERLLRLAAERWDVPTAAVRLREGWAEGPGDRRVAFGTLVSEYFGGGGNFIGRGEVRKAEFPTTPPFWEVTAGAATIAVDMETGRIRVLAYCSVADVGRVINPLLMEGQDEGAVVQGIGHSLWEALTWKEGQLLNGSLVEYKVPLLSEIPGRFPAAMVENGDGPGPFGAKGGGEGAILPVAAAVAGGLREATGVNVGDLPLTPERVWEALARAGKAEDLSGMYGM